MSLLTTTKGNTMKSKSIVKVVEPAPRYPVYLTMEEVSHIVLALEYVDADKFCDSPILETINARLGACLASHYLSQGE